MRHVTRTVGPLFEDGQLTLNATREGLGAALLRAPLIERELRSAELVKLFDQQLDDGRHYYLCRQINAELPDGARRLEAWLLKTIGVSSGTTTISCTRSKAT